MTIPEIRSPGVPRIFDVVIVGAGPAGTAAAQLLAPHLDTLLIEKASSPRYKTCGGGILPRALALLNHPDLPPCEYSCRTAEFNLSDTLHFTATRPTPIVHMTMRADFDHWLLQKALAAGIILRSSCTVQNLTQHPNHIRLLTTHGDIFARFLVAADGANSLIAKKAHFADHRHLVPALECEVTPSPIDLARFQKYARFDFHILPHGYAWVFPKKSHLSVGVLTLRPHSVNLNDTFDQYLSHLRLTPLSLQRHGYVIPLSPRSDLLARRRILLTGDAAGLADPVTAEGITHAILSGQLAARAILGNFPHSDLISSAYNRFIQEKILPELRFASRVAKVLYGPRALRNALFRHNGQKLTKAMTAVITGRTTYQSLLTHPLNYLKLFRPSSTKPAHIL